MRIAYLDCCCGISGDMTLGALVDAGASLEAISEGLRALDLAGWELRARPVLRQGITATKVDVVLAEGDADAHVHGHSFSEIGQLLGASKLPGSVKGRALAVFQRIAQAEGRIHGTPPEQVHFHELGGLDSIIDIVGVCLGLEQLGIESLIASPIPLSRGTVHCQHGTYPVPGPAVLELIKGLPTRTLDLEGETVTPTGAGLLVSLAHAFGPMPAMSIEAVGYGAGSSDFDGFPNVLRLVIGTADDAQSQPLTAAAPGLLTDVVELLQTNVDDMNPEFYELALERIFEAGALDVWLTPIQMKKGRPAVELSALCTPADSERVAEAMLVNTSSIGVRRSRFDRYCLPRETTEVATSFGSVRIKQATLRGRVVNLAPEYEDCKRLAQQHNVPVSQVYEAALTAARQRGV